MSYRQEESGLFVYPKRGWRKLFMRFPLYFWRMGLEPLLRQLRFIVLTTRGRRSGEPRRVMLEHSCIHDRVYIAPGWGERNQWYLNILADPRVTVQRTERPSERPRTSLPRTRNSHCCTMRRARAARYGSSTSLREVSRIRLKILSPGKTASPRCAWIRLRVMRRCHRCGAIYVGVGRACGGWFAALVVAVTV